MCVCGSCAIFRTLCDDYERYEQARWLAGKGGGGGRRRAMLFL